MKEEWKKEGEIKEEKGRRKEGRKTEGQEWMEVSLPLRTSIYKEVN